tara:strand:- start:327 stop:1931 length:1605 start_codon:yes stop_codon:yes gene_type:complete
MDQALKQEDIPSGGIADFIYSDEEIKLLEEKELQDLYGQNGIAQFKAIGKEMANFGRYGDDTVAHVETGELIVPRALIESNPKLKESIFGHLRELGVEDPERYVVGTSKNSLNPDTGLPEFFLKKLFKGAKKAVSSVAKGVGKALKGVGKALKRVAPVIVPLALNYFLPGLGAVYSGALGAGITTLLQGGDVKDALKSAFVGGATGAVTAGFSGKGGFGSNIATDVGKGTSNIQAALGSGSFEPLTSTAAAPSNVRDLFKGETTPTGTTDGITKASFIKPADSDAAFIDMGPKGDVFYDKNMNLIQQGGPPKPSTFYDSLKDFGSKTSDFLFGGEKVTPLEVLKKENPNLTFEQLKGIDKNSAIYLDAVEKAAAQSPGFVRRFGPSAALGIAGLSAAGAFDTPEDTPLPPLETGFDLYRKDPDRFNVADINVRGALPPVSTQTSYGFQYNPYALPTQPFQTVAEGGEIFPRRNGGISPREGTPGKDSVRAMLMPGEFVMTTDAVKGLGGGNLDKGIKNMYSVMSKLEKRGKAMA